MRLGQGTRPGTRPAHRPRCRGWSVGGARSVRSQTDSLPAPTALASWGRFADSPTAWGALSLYTVWSKTLGHPGCGEGLGLCVPGSGQGSGPS